MRVPCLDMASLQVDSCLTFRHRKILLSALWQHSAKCFFLFPPSSLKPAGKHSDQRDRPDSRNPRPGLHSNTSSHFQLCSGNLVVHQSINQSINLALFSKVLRLHCRGLQFRNHPGKVIWGQFYHIVKSTVCLCKCKNHRLFRTRQQLSLKTRKQASFTVFVCFSFCANCLAFLYFSG